MSDSYAGLLWRAAARMQQARLLLSEDAWSIAAIAERPGYAERTAFAHDVRKRVGVAPSQWRAQQVL